MVMSTKFESIFLKTEAIRPKKFAGFQFGPKNLPDFNSSQKICRISIHPKKFAGSQFGAKNLPDLNSAVQN